MVSKAGGNAAPEIWYPATKLYGNTNLHTIILTVTIMETSYLQGSYRLFGEIFYFHLQIPPKQLHTYQFTRRHISGDSDLYSHRRMRLV